VILPTADPLPGDPRSLDLAIGESSSRATVVPEIDEV
jgi:hypothetical protein